MGRRQTRPCSLKNERLSKLGREGGPWGKFQFEHIWGCMFKRYNCYDTVIKPFIDAIPRQGLRPRASFKGGRTNVIKHTVKELKEGERLAYLDFTSLYPAVQWGTKDEVWPVGYPDIYLSVEAEEKAPKLKDSLGLWFCEVLPPRELRHPVLPYTVKDKLLFPLCRTCAERGRPGRCTHMDEERVLSGTFTTMELNKAVKKGYEIIKVEEVWNWPPERRSKDMFREMITDQYGKKVLASKLPPTPEGVAQLLDHLYELGVRNEAGERVTVEDFEENPTVRALAKFCINNIWGYLGKREDVTEFLITDRLAEEERIDKDPRYELLSALLHGMEDDDPWLMLSYKKLGDKPGRNGNIVLASMTTSYARLRLYEVIEKYPDQVVYFDTDSVFLLLPPGMEGPPTSSKLGDLKDEILETYGPGHRIVDFAATGPKSYTYRFVALPTVLFLLVNFWL